MMLQSLFKLCFYFEKMPQKESFIQACYFISLLFDWISLKRKQSNPEKLFLCLDTILLSLFTVSPPHGTCSPHCCRTEHTEAIPNLSTALFKQNNVGKLLF